MGFLALESRLLKFALLSWPLTSPRREGFWFDQENRERSRISQPRPFLSFLLNQGGRQTGELNSTSQLRDTAQTPGRWGVGGKALPLKEAFRVLSLCCIGLGQLQLGCNSCSDQTGGQLTLVPPLSSEPATLCNLALLIPTQFLRPVFQQGTTPVGCLSYSCGIHST